MQPLNLAGAQSAAPRRPTQTSSGGGERNAAARAERPTTKLVHVIGRKGQLGAASCAPASESNRAELRWTPLGQQRVAAGPGLVLAARTRGEQDNSTRRDDSCALD